VDIRTAHGAKGAQTEHVIIPKVVRNHGYSSIQGERWVEPVTRPPAVYEEHDVSYRLEEERRLFYVALTRTASHLDVLTVQGAESVFIEELPDEQCQHVRPLSDDELNEIETSREVRRTVTGTVEGTPNDYFATVDWNDGELVSMNLYDAAEE
jgi:DNA helicase-4